MTDFHDQQLVALVVDDEPLIRMLAVDILNDQGIAAFEAGDGVEALAVLDSHPEIFLLVTDINMPGDPDGLGLACEARMRRPTLKIIVTSGRVTPRLEELPDGGMFVSKPYTVKDLLQAISASAGAWPS